MAATLFGVFYAGAGAQGMVMEALEGMVVNRWVILFIMQFILLVFGSSWTTMPS